MTRTLITGAGGFTGRYLAAVLKARGHKVHGLFHLLDAGHVDHVDVIHYCDLRDSDGLAKIVAQVRPDHVVHLAAISFVAHGNVAEMYDTNVLGTRNLLESVAHHGRDVRSIIVVSSANIYGNRAGQLNEDMPLSPLNDYGVSKVATEMLCRMFADRLPLIVTRPFNYTGAGQSPQFLIPKIVDHSRRRSPQIELGNMDVARDFSDVRTVVDAYARLLETPGAVGGTFNVCSGEAVSLKSVLDCVERLSGHSMDAVVNPTFVRSNEVISLCGNPSRIQSAIGPLIAIRLEQTLLWMLDG